MVLFFLCTVLTIGAASAIHPTAYRNESVVETGEHVSYEWYPVPAINKSAAAAFCKEYDSTLPSVFELRYFYKSLTSGGEASFYMKDFMETTMDSPNEAIGERMCISIKSMPGAPLQFAEITAKTSCTIEVTAIVCRKVICKAENDRNSRWSHLLTYPSSENGKMISLSKTLFFSIVASLCLLVLTTGILLAVLCYKCNIVRHRSNAPIGKGSSALFSNNGPIKAVGISGFTALQADFAPINGRYDLLPDNNFKCGSLRRSSSRLSTRLDNNASGNSQDCINKNDTGLKDTDLEATGFL